VGLAPDDPRRIGFGTVGFDRSLAGAVLEDADDGEARIRLTVTEAVANPVGTLHGGAIATLVDDAGTLAIMSADAEGRPGVTTDLQVSYLRAAPVGAPVVAEARVLKIGRTLAFVEVVIRTESDRELAHGHMTKFMAGPGSSRADESVEEMSPLA